MSTVLNPNNNQLIVAGNLLVEDFLVVNKDTLMYGDLDVQDVKAKDITSENIFNNGEIQTNQLVVFAFTQLNGDTQINGTLTVDGVDIQNIGAPGDEIEFYYGNEMTLNTLLVNEQADIKKIISEEITTDTMLINTELDVLGTTEVQDLTVNEELTVAGPVTFADEFEMLDKEYKKDFFDEPVANTIFVKKDGNDARSGRSEAGAVKTIKRGLELARTLRKEVESTICVVVGPGIYVEDGGLEVPERCAMISKAGQYVTEIHMSERGRKEFRNMILCNSGSYVQGFGYRNLEVDDFDDPSGGFAYAFAPGALIERSPYVRDSSQVSNEPYLKLAAPLDPENGNPEVGRGGGMILADRSVVSPFSTYPGFLAFGATPRSPNGIGYVAKNGAFVNGISSLTIYQRCSFYALNGGQLTLNNSGTQFGDISLRSSGNTRVVSPNTVSSSDILIANVAVADAIAANVNVLTDQIWDDLVANGPDRFGNVRPDPNFVEWTDPFSYNEAICQRDVGYILNAVKLDLALRTNHNTLTAGMSYSRNIAGSQYVRSNQYNQTLAAIDYVEAEVLKVTSALNKEKIKMLFENIYKNIRTSDIAHQTYYEIPGIANYNREKCFRDIGLIMENIALDLILETNHNTVTAGLAYRRGSSADVYGEQLQQTVLALEFARDEINDLGIDPTSQAKITASFTEIINILQNGDQVASAIVYPSTYAEQGATGDHANAALAIQANRAAIITELTEWIGGNFPGLVTYDTQKCRRDLGYIIDSVKRDLVLGTDYNTITSAQAYLRSNSAYVLSDQSEFTIAAVQKARDLINALPEVTNDLIVNSLFARVINVLNGAVTTFVAPQFPTTPGSVYQTANTNNAAAVIQSNKTSLVNQVLAYIDANENIGFSYDETLCKRDVGYILDAVSLDQALGTNFNSVLSGQAYQRANAADVIGDQLIATTGALNYLKNTLLPTVVSNSNQLTLVQDGVTEVVNGLNSLPPPVYTYATPDNPPNGSFSENAFTIIGNNINFLKAETTAYLADQFPAFVYNVATCERDVGFILEGFQHDIKYGGTFASTASARAYFAGAASQLGVGEDDETVAVYNHIRDVLNDLILGNPVTPTTGNAQSPVTSAAGSSTETARITTLMGLITGVITAGNTNSLPVATLPNVANLYNTSANLVQTQDEISSAKTTLQESVITFINANYAVFDQAACERDTGFVLDAITHDIKYGGNSASRLAADAYFVGTASQLGPGESVPTANAYTQLKGFVSNVIATPAEQTLANTLIDVVIDVIVAGNLLGLPAEQEIDTTGLDVTEFDAITAAETEVIDDTITFVNTSYFQTTYNVEKCERDTGYILDAATHDVLYGGSFASVRCAEAYFVDTDGRANPGEESLIGEGEVEASVAAYDELKNIIAQYVLTPAENANIANNIDIIRFALDRGASDEIPEPIEPISTIPGNATTDYQTILNGRGQVQTATLTYSDSEAGNVLGYFPTPNADDAHNLLVLNRSFLQDSVVNYVETNYSGLGTSTATCRRDAGFIIDAIAHDIFYGGNYATNRAADSYYSFGDLVIPPAEKSPTINTWNYLSSLMQDTVRGLAAGQEIYPYTVATLTEANDISGLMAIITDHINNPITNPLPANVFPDLSWVDSTTGADFVNITDNTATIQASTTEYVNSLYKNYFEDVCKRDDSLIIDAIAKDLRGGTEMVTQTIAQSYFRWNGDLLVPSEQLLAFQHVWNKLKDILQNDYCGGPTTDAGVMVGELIDALNATITNPTYVTFGSLVESLAHQFNNAGAGVNQNALPLNLNKPGFNRPVQFSVLQENGGRVRWSGADEINNQYFAGGTKINGQTGKFEGRPFNISVRAIARRLANSRGGF